jgi:hypothetical protein
MSNPVTAEVNGQSVTGRYTVRGGMITVSTINGSKTTQIGNMWPLLKSASARLSEIGRCEQFDTDADA